jgi:hypothetical protein
LEKIVILEKFIWREEKIYLEERKYGNYFGKMSYIVKNYLEYIE